MSFPLKGEEMSLKISKQWEKKHISPEASSTSLLEDNLKRKEELRKKRYIEFWELYKGNHWSNSELDSDAPPLVWNKILIAVNKGVSFLVGKPPTFSFASKEIEKILSPYVEMILENSGGQELFFYESAQMGSITGDCFVKPYYDASKKKVSLQVLDSGDVSVSYNFYNYNNSIPDSAIIEYAFINEEDSMSMYREEIYSDKIVVYIDDEISQEFSGDNILGKPYLVHIKNLILGKEPYGISDIAPIEGLNKSLNSSIRKTRDILDYHGDPVTLLYGARVDQLEKGENKLWGNLPTDAKVENLELTTELPAHTNFTSMLEDAIFEVSQIPEGSTKGLKDISNTSGVSLQLQYMPITEKVLQKRITYGQGYSNAISLALEILYFADKKYNLGTGIIEARNEVESIINSSEDSRTKQKAWNWSKVNFNDFLPKDELIQMQLIRDEMSLGLEDREGALHRIGRYKDVKDKIERVDEERVKEIQFNVSHEYNSKGNEYAPTNHTQGMRHETETPAGASKEILNG